MSEPLLVQQVHSALASHQPWMPASWATQDPVYKGWMAKLQEKASLASNAEKDEVQVDQVEASAEILSGAEDDSPKTAKADT